MFVELFGGIDLTVAVFAANGVLLLSGLLYYFSLGRSAQDAAFFALPRRRFLSHTEFGRRALNFLRPKEVAQEHLDGQIDLGTFGIEQIAPNPVAQGNVLARGAKRAVDIVASIGLLVFMLPILAITAMAIKLETPGPVLYKQTRIGRHGRAFCIYKFRSMTLNAEQNGVQWAQKDDARVTTVGRFIRKSRIDEIPQTINILKGEMSFVGPRPERPEFTELLIHEIQHYDKRHTVKPGLTGWAQINYHYGGSVEDAREKLAYDLYYIKHFSFLLDLFIMLRTVKVAVFGIGSR